jgi:hypothetical protein
MGVQLHPHLVRQRLDLGLGSVPADQVGQPRDVLGREHVLLGEDEPVDRVVGRGGPVDQLVEDVAVGTERQNRRHRPGAQALFGGQPGAGGELVQVFRREGAESAAGGSHSGRRRVIDQGHVLLLLRIEGKRARHRTRPAAGGRSLAGRFNSFALDYGVAAGDAVTLPAPLNPESPVSHESDTRWGAYRYADTGVTDLSTSQEALKCQLDTPCQRLEPGKWCATYCVPQVPLSDRSHCAPATAPPSHVELPWVNIADGNADNAAGRGSRWSRPACWSR